MSNISINNLSYQKLEEDVHNRLGYKILRTGLTGLMVLSIVPFIVGCGKKKESDISNPQQTRIEYFNENERNSSVIIIDADFTNEGLDELQDFGSQVKEVYIDYALNVDDLSKLADYCPNIEKLHISYSPSITDLSFIYSLQNLNQLDITENGYITPELVEYLNSKGIQHNITQADLENVEEIDRIISEIITDDMTDEEKIQAITYYVMDNYHYNILNEDVSNDNPLSSVLKDHEGVCASYAYLTNILLRKAGISSYEVFGYKGIRGHAWNLIELDGKYYYLDMTNINQIPFISKMVLEKFNIGFFYMTDPKDTFLSPMVNFDEIEKISIPEEMIEDIERGESRKTIIEKYGNSVPARIIEIMILTASITIGFTLAASGMIAISDTISYKKYMKNMKENNNDFALDSEETKGRGYY